MRKSLYFAGAAGVIVATGLGAGRLLADQDYFQPVRDPVVAKECSSCHMLYPVGLLPAQSWARIVNGLANHFGENASVDAQTAEQLKAYLTGGDASALQVRVRRGGPGLAEPPLRITELDWFRAEHGPRKASPAALQARGAKSLGDCAACHRDAALGIFED